MAGVPPVTTAYVSIVLAACISVALIVWGWLDRLLPPVLVGAYMLISSYQLFQHVRAGLIAQHPLFRHTCEQQQAGQAYQHNAPLPPHPATKEPWVPV